MKNIGFIVFAFFLTSSLFLLTVPVLADDTCQTNQYGVQTCPPVSQLTVAKQVFDPARQMFVDNLGPGDHLFNIGDTVTFRLMVTNSGGTDLNNIQVTDTLPPLLTASPEVLSFTIPELSAGSSQERSLITTVVSDNRFPVGQIAICQLNNIVATASGLTNSASSQICFGQQIPAAPVLPPTGPENWWLLTGMAGILGTTGVLSLFRVRRGVKNE